MATLVVYIFFVCPRFRFCLVRFAGFCCVFVSCCCFHLHEQSSDKTVATEPHKESICDGRYAILVHPLIVVIILEYQNSGLSTVIFSAKFTTMAVSVLSAT